MSDFRDDQGRRDDVVAFSGARGGSRLVVGARCSHKARFAFVPSSLMVPELLEGEYDAHSSG
jgi:hypothetical protein